MTASATLSNEKQTLPSAATPIPFVEENAATGRVAEAYAEYRIRFGRDHVPGILKCFATHPSILAPILSLATNFLFAESDLPRAAKEMIATHVSCINACPYCLDSHASSLRKEGGSEELLYAIFQSNLANSSISEKDRRLLLFSGKVTEESDNISASDVESLQSVGWTQQQIAEAVHVTALFACFNRVANAFGLQSQNLFDPRPIHPPVQENA